MPTPHKHKDIIIAWANGAQIQYKSPFSSYYEDVKNPMFNGNGDYRIKPEVVPEPKWHFVDGVKPTWADGQMVYYMNTYNGTAVLGPVSINSIAFSVRLGNGEENKVTFIKIVK